MIPIFYTCILLFRGQVDKVPYEYYECKSAEKTCEVLLKVGDEPKFICH